MRILPNGDGLSQNLRQKGRINDRPRKISGITTALLLFDLPSTISSTPDFRRSPPWIPNFHKNCETLTDLLQKVGIRIELASWEKAVRRLNWTIHFRTVHRTPRTDQQFILYVDASQFAILGNIIPGGQGTTDG